MRRIAAWVTGVSACCLIALSLAPTEAAQVSAKEGETFLAVVPFEYALHQVELRSSRAIAISRDEVLVLVAPGERAIAEDLSSRGFGIAALEAPSGRVWLAAGNVPDEVAGEAGTVVIYRTAWNTVLLGDLDSAYRLLDRGFFVVEADFVPVEQLSLPQFGPSLTEKLLAARPLTEARRRFLAGIAGAVDPDTLRNTIRYLNYDESVMNYRSRFAPRHEMRRVVRPYLSQVLEDRVASAGGSVEGQEFKPDLPAKYKGDDSVFVNVIASKPGRRTSAYYLVCAHYDAIAVRDPLWNASDTAWLTLPAPGADDNASGTAAVIEVARLLEGIDLDVGVKFVAFSGEELGLLGSQFYADSLARTDSIIGVINLDMVGYVQGQKYIALEYDTRSKWLSDLLHETASAIGAESQMESFDHSGIHRSDHASFWSFGIPGVMLADRENAGADPVYPYYHMLGDTLGNLDMGQVSDDVAIVAAYLARFAEVQEDTLSDIELTDGSIEWSWQGTLPLVAGSQVTATVRAINMGGSMLEPEPYRLEIWRGGRGTGTLIQSQDVSLQVLAGEYTHLAASWRTDPDVIGIVPYTFALTPVSSGVESDLANNVVEVTLKVMPPSAVVSRLHVFPNPLTGGATPHVYFEIWQPRNDFIGRMDLFVYDLEGNRLAQGTLVRNFTGTKEIATGPNSINLEDVFPGGLDLAPGLYVVVAELSVTSESGVASATAKFAVAR